MERNQHVLPSHVIKAINFQSGNLEGNIRVHPFEVELDVFHRQVIHALQVYILVEAFELCQQTWIRNIEVSDLNKGREVQRNRCDH